MRKHIKSHIRTFSLLFAFLLILPVVSIGNAVPASAEEMTLKGTKILSNSTGSWTSSSGAYYYRCTTEKWKSESVEAGLVESFDVVYNPGGVWLGPYGDQNNGGLRRIPTLEYHHVTSAGDTVVTDLTDINTGTVYCVMTWCYLYAVERTSNGEVAAQYTKPVFYKFTYQGRKTPQIQALTGLTMVQTHNRL